MWILPGQVYWLVALSTRRAFPVLNQWPLRLSSPLTVAGPQRNCTAFPFQPRRRIGRLRRYPG